MTSARALSNVVIFRARSIEGARTKLGAFQRDNCGNITALEQPQRSLAPSLLPMRQRCLQVPEIPLRAILTHRSVLELMGK
jgi:hypothetical protein